jgi:FtsP/CotA-like multicopper oxidase with cupredoxin domain
MNRRDFLTACSALGASNLLATSAWSSQPVPISLSAEPGETFLVGPNAPATRVWTFNGQVPGTPIRISHGDPLAVTLNNKLEVPTAVHWHGIRLPNAMDGVAGLTQPAVKPDEQFEYAFTPPDAGTYWYHSHVNAYEQVGRGLYGPLIIEERDPPRVDRDLVWMIDDWRLLEDASISEDFGAGHDLSHAGRIGNVPTVNGRFRDVVKVRSGERIRLRLINAANARNFALDFTDLSPEIIAIDGQAVTPYQATGPIVIGAAGRVDLILDLTGKPGSRSSVTDSFYRDSYDLTSFVYESGEPLRQSPPDWPTRLAAPSLPEPDLDKAITQPVVIAGGAMGGLRQAKLDGQWMDLRKIAEQGYVWALNDTVANTLDMPPLIDVERGTSVRFQIENRTAFPHPMHLHGHHMKLLSIDDQPVTATRWVDSPLVMPRQRMELAFVADNPGKWLFHCHVLEHHAAGMGALVRVR